MNKGGLQVARDSQESKHLQIVEPSFMLGFYVPNLTYDQSLIIGGIMARYVSSRNPITTCALKRKQLGSVVVHHWTCGEVKFTRVHGGWLCEREDSVWVAPAEVVSSADVATECNKALGCKESWAKVY